MAIIESNRSHFYGERASNYLADFVARTRSDPALYCVEHVIDEGGLCVFRIRDVADRPKALGAGYGFPRGLPPGEQSHTGALSKGSK